MLRRVIGDDAKLRAEVLTGFVRINAPIVEKLERLAGSKDYPAIGALAHRLLGSARTSGAHALAHSLERLETGAAHRDGGVIEAQTRIAAGEMARVREYVAKACA